jgi:glycosyltransferase involved in cell wall biosynthesis
MIRFSLVIATLHDDGDLAHCLRSLTELTDPPEFEVIVVDQNGDDRLAGVIADHAGRLEIVHERVAYRGASRARNHGARLARGAWVGFPDDDCRLLSDTLHEVARLSADPALRVVTGQTIDDQDAPNVLRWRRETIRFTRWNMFGCLTEATLFVDKACFLEAGGFDERFGPGAAFPAAEGIDLMNRLFQRYGDGLACYSPQVRMRHPSKIPPWSRWAVGRFYAYAQGDGALIAKSPRPHMLYWGARTLASALLQTLLFRGWRSLAFGARVAGLLRGFVAYRVGPARRITADPRR